MPYQRFFGLRLHNEGILSKSKGEATRCISCLHQGHQAELPRPYATLKFEEDTNKATNDMAS